jgi:antitoxin component of MazEF toxin-antitoxin module
MKNTELYIDVTPDGHIRIPEQVMKQLNISVGSKLRFYPGGADTVILEVVNEKKISTAKKLVESFKNRLKNNSIGKVDEDQECIEGITVREYFGMSDKEQEMLWDRLYREAEKAR